MAYVVLHKRSKYGPHYCLVCCRRVNGVPRVKIIRYLGVTRTAVARTLKAMKREALAMARKKKGRQREALRKIAFAYDKVLERFIIKHTPEAVLVLRRMREEARKAAKAGRGA